MYITYQPQLEPATFEEQCQDVIATTIAWVEKCGTAPEDAAKFVRLFNSEDSPCFMISPKLWAADVTGYVRDECGSKLGTFSGHRRVVPQSGARPYDLHLRKGVPQTVYAFCVERAGNIVKGEGRTRFWSINTIVAETSPGQPPLHVGMDLEWDGIEAHLQWSRRLYIGRQNGRTIDRLATLVKPTNVEALILEALYYAEFPVEDSRINRLTRDDRMALRAGGGRFTGSGGRAGGGGRGPAVTEQRDDPYGSG